MTEQILESIKSGFQIYYGLDWLASILIIISIALLGSKKRIGFLVGMVACLIWIYINILADIFAGILLNFIMVFMNLNGYLKWKK